MIEGHKVKITTLDKELFPELQESLVEHGQLTPILIDANGYIHDGQKRVLLCGLEQLEQLPVDINAPCSNIGNITRKQKKDLVLMQYELCKKGYGNRAVEKLSQRYGVTEKTVYNWINHEQQKVKNYTFQRVVICPFCNKEFKLTKEVVKK